jgi:sulfite reductase alpha subunit-like flavoprotein
MSIHILFGSQTGTAREGADQVSRAGVRRGISSHPRSFLGMTVWSLIEHVNPIVILLSTTGDGEMPDDTIAFWKSCLVRSLSSSLLSNVRFVIFGYGDSSYPKFNASARKMCVRLQQLGANLLLPIGFADYQSPLGPDADLDAWLRNVWETFSSLPELSSSFHQPLVDSLGVEVPAQVQADFTAQKVDKVSDSFNLTPYARSNTIEGIVLRNQRLSSLDWAQGIFQLDMNVSDSKFTYEPGDVAIIYPHNSLDQCERLCSRLSIDLDDVITISKHSESSQLKSLPEVISVKTLFLMYLDIQGIPKRSFFEQLSFFASSLEERDKLRELSSSVGSDLFASYVMKEKRTYVEVLEEFPSVDLPLSNLISLIPEIYPRCYSISSSPTASSHEVSLTYAVVDYKTKLGRRKLGLCSSWLSKLIPGNVVSLSIRSGIFKCSREVLVSKPLILVGPGTGIAPIRSIVQERLSIFEQNHLSLPECRVYFGCRKPDCDSIYREEFERLVDLSSPRGGIDAYEVAYSRQHSYKVYVQSLILRDKDVLYPLIVEKEAIMFVSGSALRMPNDVKSAIVEVVSSCGRISVEDAQKYVTMMERTKRIIFDCW